MFILNLQGCKGPNTKHTDDDDEDETTCGDHGTKWTVNFNISVLGKYNTPKKLIEALEEIIRSRYEPSYYQPYIINLTIIEGSVEIKESSSNWKSLKGTLSEEVKNGGIEKTHDTVIKFDNTTVNFVAFTITEDGLQWITKNKHNSNKCFDNILKKTNLK